MCCNGPTAFESRASQAKGREWLLQWSWRCKDTMAGRWGRDELPPWGMSEHPSWVFHSCPDQTKAFSLTSASGLESSLLQRQKGQIREFLGLGLQGDKVSKNRGRVKKTDRLRQRNVSSKEGPYANRTEAQYGSQGKWTARLGAPRLTLQPSSHHICARIENTKVTLHVWGLHLCVPQQRKKIRYDFSCQHPHTCPPSTWKTGDDGDGPRGPSRSLKGKAHFLLTSFLTQDRLLCRVTYFQRK